MATLIFFLLLVLLCMVAYLIDQVRNRPAVLKVPEPDDVEWVVNDNAELGVRISNRFYFLYKGGSLEYDTPVMHADGTPMLWRPVGKREFGECCRPPEYKGGRYTAELQFIAGLSDGDEAKYKWKPLNDPSNTD